MDESFYMDFFDINKKYVFEQTVFCLSCCCRGVFVLQKRGVEWLSPSVPDGWHQVWP